MTEPNLEETRPVSGVSDDPQSTQPAHINDPISPELLEALSPGTDLLPKALRPRKGCLHSWVIWAATGILLLAVIAILSGWLGSRVGLEWRLSAKATADAQDVLSQFNLAVQDMDAGRYGLARQRLEWFKTQSKEFKILDNTIIQELARQYQLGIDNMGDKQYEAARLRFEWIVEWDPTFPGIADRLAEVIYQLNTTATPTSVPTATLTPTPDLRGIEELYTHAQLLIANGDWTAAIDTLLSLRKKDPTYKAVQVDGMLFVALRNRGVQQITTTDITKVDLEGGMYDLSQAEQFGPLDVEALAWRKRAGWYVTGASLWGLNWADTVAYFELLYIESPYLFDASGYAAIERYKDALVKYGDWLAALGEWCLAQEQYQKALAITANPNVEPTAVYAGEQCTSPGELPGGEEPTATPEVPLTATPTPTEEATPEPLPTETPTSSTPYP